MKTDIPGPTKGLLYMLMATIVLACMHGLVRYLGDGRHLFVIVLYRNRFGYIAIFPGNFRQGHPD